MVIAALLAAPGMANAATFSAGGIFAGAAPFQKLLMLGLVIATLVGVVISIRKLASGPRLSGGSAFVSGLRLGGPIAGILGASFAALRMCVGIASATYTPTLKTLAPGCAEVAALVGLGFLSGAIAVLLHWAIEAQIDKQVLRA